MNKTFLQHHGILGQKWGVRRYQNPDGSLTPRGEARRDRKDNKWASTKGEKIRQKLQKKAQKDVYVDDMVLEYTAKGRFSSKTMLEYNTRLAKIMNQRVGDVRAPSGRVLQFVAKRGTVGVHTAVADAGYDMDQLKRGVFSSGKVAYKKQNLMKGG